MYSFKSTDGWYEGRPVASASTPPNLSSARSSRSTNTSIARTGLSSQIQSSRHSGNSVFCPRSVPSTKRFIRPLRKSRRNHTLRITSLSTFLHNQDPLRTWDVQCNKRWLVRRPQRCPWIETSTQALCVGLSTMQIAPLRKNPNCSADGDHPAPSEGGNDESRSLDDGSCGTRIRPVGPGTRSGARRGRRPRGNPLSFHWCA